MAVPDTKSTPLTLPGLPPERLPRHIAVIMDGNGRWAAARDKPRFEGHRAGVESARRIVEHCGRLGIGALTLYSFSQENWKRPVTEVDALMQLLVDVLPPERRTLIDNNVRFRVIGSREGLAPDVLRELDTTCEESAHCTGLQLNVALNYGSRQEIVDATRRLAQQARDGTLDPADIDETMFSNSLWTAGLPDPDLLIRTAGEYRISNYLLWQISYAEIHVSDLFWPDFDESALEVALRDFAARSRRFGALDTDTDDAS
ncbi:MAG: isoprenyl transferase [Phycisphaerales bacterium]|nr:isoprenyl transferase [Phycisphaerales bacterium]